MVGGVYAGWQSGSRGWLTGLVGVGFSWLLIIFYDYAWSPHQTTAMLTAVGEISGNLPVAAVVAISLLPGCILGGMGGLIGAQLNVVIRRPTKAAGS